MTIKDFIEKELSNYPPETEVTVVTELCPVCWSKQGYEVYIKVKKVKESK